MSNAIYTKVGQTEVMALNDFTEMQSVRGEGGFFPDVTEEELKRLNELYPEYLDGNCIPAWTYYCYIIRDREKTILIDTGVGNPEFTKIKAMPQWKGELLNKMQKIGICPTEIDIVFHTHLHADHIGWNVISKDGRQVKTFPNARYIASAEDYEAYHNSITASAIPADIFNVHVEKLVAEENMDIINEDRFDLSEHVHVSSFPGHVPGHMCVEVSDGDDVYIIAGDLFASPIQITNPTCNFLYDIDSKKANEEKAKVLNSFEGKNYILGACHFGPGKITMANNLRIWKPLK